MASATSQLTLPKALEIAKKSWNGDVDPAVTTFLDLSMYNIWQRVQAQPSTYLFTKEEFAVFNYHRGAFSGNEIAQQAVQRFWEHQRFLQAAGEKRAAVPSPRMTGEIAFEHEHTEQQALAANRAAACQRCLRGKAKCDAKGPACTPCNRAGRSAECTYDAKELVPPWSTVKQRMNERFAWRDNNVDEGEEIHKEAPRSNFSEKSQVTRERKLQIEILNDLRESFKPRRLKKSRIEPTETITSWDNPVKRPDELTTQTWEVDPGYLKSPKTVPVDSSRFRMQLENAEEYNLINSVKTYVEYLTGAIWDWWPLRPSFRQLRVDEIRIQWRCVSHDLYCLTLGLLTI